MKTTRLLFVTLLAFAALITSLHAATVTGRSAKTTPAGTEKIPIDDAGVDKYITIGNLFVGSPALTTPTLTTPVISTGLSASGSAANDFSGSTGAFKLSTGAATFGGSSNTFSSVLQPASNGGAALGTASYSFSNLFLASTGTINFANSNVVLTHATGNLTVSTGDFRVTTAGTNAASVPTLGSTSTLTNKTLTAPVLNGATSASGNFDLSGSSGTFKSCTGANTFGGSSHTFASAITPATDDGGALGSASLQWSDLFLASGAVIKFASTNVVLTHSSGVLTLGTGDLRITTAGTNSASVVTVGGTQTLTNKTLTAPVLGAATATTINKVTITAPASGSTLTIADGKTLTFNNTITLAGTDSTTMTFPATSNTVFTSSLSTNDVDAANALWGASNALVFEGATADAYETSVSPVDPTADQTVSIPNFAVNWAIIGSTLTTNSIDAANSFWGASNTLVFEGATANAFETILTPVDPTADQTVSIPNFAVNWAILGSTLTTNTIDAANSVWGASNGLVFEGATADTYETTITLTDPTADHTVTVPDSDGTVSLAQASTTTALTADNQAVTPGSNTRLQLTSDNATATSRTFTLSATGAITGQIYILIGPATNACEIADTGIQKLNATWTPGATDTLTLLFDGTNFIELARSDN